MAKQVFVFGSNEAGIHGAGAAKVAYEKHGARWGFSYGKMGDSFAIPTKDINIDFMPLSRIKAYVAGFLAFAEGHKDLTFKVTRIGCGLAGYQDDMIAPMFIQAPANCLFDEAWAPYLQGALPMKQYWGTF